MQTLGNTKINRVLLRGDDGDESSLTEDLIRKQSSLFINSVSHNTGYFLTVNFNNYTSTDSISVISF